MSLRNIPPVEQLLQSSAAESWVADYGRPLTITAIRSVLDDIRLKFKTGQFKDVPVTEIITNRIESQLQSWTRPTLTPVINATGVILHTNMDRAPLADSAINALVAASRGYLNLEFDLATGKRGSRHIHAEQIIKLLTGAEAALVVNNNAAAVLLYASISMFSTPGSSCSIRCAFSVSSRSCSGIEAPALNTCARRRKPFEKSRRTGQWFDNATPSVRELSAQLNAFAAPVIVTSGNHELYTGYDNAHQMLSSTKVRWLRNEAVEFGGIRIIGIDNSYGTELLQSVLSRLPSSAAFTILMSHQPRGFDLAASHRIRLMLSGHVRQFGDL